MGFCSSSTYFSDTLVFVLKPVRLLSDVILVRKHVRMQVTIFEL